MFAITTPVRLSSVLTATAILSGALALPCPALCGTETSLANTVPGWYYRMPAGFGASTNNLFFALDATSATNLYFGGMYMPTSMEDLVNMRGLAFWSQDAGANAKDISGTAVGGSGGLLGGSMCTLTSMDAVSTGAGAPDIWASCGNFLALAAANNKFNQKFDAPAAGEDPDQLNCIHMFDGGHGVAGAESGKIYLFELNEDGKAVTFTPADITNTAAAAHPSASPSVVAMHWLSGKTGWAVAVDGEALTESGYEGNDVEKQMYYQTRVFRTTDGGESWDLQGTIDLNPTEDPVHQVSLNGGTSYPLSFEGGWLPVDIRMVDADTGFLSLSAWDSTKQMTIVAKILKTTDGGRTWTDMQVNMQVGTLESIFTQPIFITDVAGTYFWKDAQGQVKGRVAGAAFVAEGGSSGGTPPKYYYLATLDLDGEGAWTKHPDLQTVKMDMTGGGTVINTPRPFDAVFIDQYRGFAVGEKGTVFRFQYKCTTQSQCDFGYYCHNKQLTCLSCADIGLTDHAGSIEKCSTWTPPPEDEELTGRDAWEPGDDDATILVDATGGRDLAGWDGNDTGGCHAGHHGHLASAILLLLVAAGTLLAVVRARLRARRGAGNRQESSINREG